MHTARRRAKLIALASNPIKINICKFMHFTYIFREPIPCFEKNIKEKIHFNEIRLRQYYYWFKIMYNC